MFVRSSLRLCSIGTVLPLTHFHSPTVHPQARASTRMFSVPSVCQVTYTDHPALFSLPVSNLETFCAQNSVGTDSESHLILVEAGDEGLTGTDALFFCVGFRCASRHYGLRVPWLLCSTPSHSVIKTDGFDFSPPSPTSDLVLATRPPGSMAEGRFVYRCKLALS